jgi:sterol desaturase/sphingolipid hydroxylase (fatty acid hydroxylase superfamily)
VFEALARFCLNLWPYMAMIVALTALEWAFPVGRFSLRSRLPGFGFWFVTLVLAAFMLAAVSALWRMLGVQPLVTVPLGSLGAAAAIAFAVLLADFTAYWNHRFQHRFLWRIHALHHSMTDLHAANGYGHFTERSLRFLLFAVPLTLVRFDGPQVPLAIVMTRELLERYIHCPTRLHFGPLRRVLVDNRFHRIHHSTRPEHFDRNFGILFSFWDRMFGTAVEPKEWPDTGVPGILPPGSIGDYVMFPLRARRSDTGAPPEAAPAIHISTPHSPRPSAGRLSSEPNCR